MEKLFRQLKENLSGEVHTDPQWRKIYSVDASIYEVEPLCIVIPKNIQELILTLQIAAEHNIPVTARGAATGITGSCLGKGIIIDISKYFNKIIEINIDEEYAICESGVVQDRLNESLSPFGYRLGPDTSTGNRATLGGMTANNSAGARSLYFGCMADHIQEIELFLSGGEKMLCHSLDKREWDNKCLQQNREGQIYREIARILKEYRKPIEQHFPKIPRHCSGYNLDRLLNAPPLNLSSIIAGSEGTLGIAAKVKLKIVKKPKHIGLCVVHIADMIKDLHAVPKMLSHHPLALEMIDEKILAMARLSPVVKNKLGWLVGMPQALFVAEFEGATPNEVRGKLEHFAEKMKSMQIGYAHLIIQDPEQIQNVWEVRKSGLGLLLSKRSYNRAIAFIEDLSIGPERLPSFMEQFSHYLKRIGKEAGIYGHIGSGCMHIRPYIDLRKPEEVSSMKQIMNDVSDMVLEHGGAMSGEHGDGLIRSWLNEKMFGKEVYRAFKELKAAFDPFNLMNPGKIVDGPAVTENLRLSPEIKEISIPTFLDFSDEGGFELAADLCNGNGQCRKMENVMCPSFQASGDEYDTTRARAQSLRAIIHGRLPIEEFTGSALHDVLDLCIECKGCKKECPSQVDMAKMKTEVLYQYQEKNGYSFRARLFGHIHTLNRLSSPFANLFNIFSRSTFGKASLEWLGISSKRELPELTSERFSKWFNMQHQPPCNKKVVLFNDTYTEFNQPDIGKAAYKILKALGFEVILSNNFCCGRPLISKGLLKQAKAYAEQVVDSLQFYSKQNLPIIVLEPSCLSAMRDDFKGLLGQNSDLDLVRSQCFSLEEFLIPHLIDGFLPLSFNEKPQDLLVHGHCHQKALVGPLPTLQVLRGVKGFNVKEIESGCCGVAGSFGYEKEHYDFSMKIGELRLLPAVRAASPDTILVASGISCRSQIFHSTGRHALHLAEAIANNLI